jgi:hypothetical protein
VLGNYEKLENIGPFFDKINPCKLAEIIYETHIVIVSTNRGWSGPP